MVRRKSKKKKKSMGFFTSLCQCFSYNHDSSGEEPLFGPSLQPNGKSIEEERELSAYDSEWPVQPENSAMPSKSANWEGTSVASALSDDWSEPSNQYNSSASTVIYESLFKEHQKPKHTLHDSSNKRSFLVDALTSYSDLMVHRKVPSDAGSNSDHRKQQNCEKRRKSKQKSKSKHRDGTMDVGKNNRSSKASKERPSRLTHSGRHSSKHPRHTHRPDSVKSLKVDEQDVISQRFKGVNFIDDGDQHYIRDSNKYDINKPERANAIEHSQNRHSIMKNSADTLYYTEGNRHQTMDRNSLMHSKRLTSPDSHNSYGQAYDLHSSSEMRTDYDVSSPYQPRSHSQPDSAWTNSSEYLTAPLTNSSSDYGRSTSHVPSTNTRYSMDASKIHPSTAYSETLSNLRSAVSPLTSILSYNPKRKTKKPR